MTGKMVVSVTNGLRPAVGRQEIDCLFSAGPELLGGCVREGRRRRRIEGIFMSPFTLVHRVVVPLCSSSSLPIAPLKLVDSDWSVPHLARPKYFDSDFTFSSDSSSIGRGVVRGSVVRGVAGVAMAAPMFQILFHRLEKK